MYRCLGIFKGSYLYHCEGEQGVVALTAREHTKTSLLRLAPLSHWATTYPDKKDTFALLDAVGALMGGCQDARIFDMDRIRGRGVWMDDGEPVIHYGDKVVRKGKEYLPFHTPGKYIYEAGNPLGMNKEVKPLTDTQGAAFPDAMKRLKWQTEDQFMWYCGWIICAMTGGGLPWRPHIWLTGAAQSGKSTIAAIMKKLLGRNCLYIQSVSTEAGIRQSLAADCIPVIMDEAEREDSHSHGRIQGILTLARQASSAGGGAIVKGSPTGKAMNFNINSCFALSSINNSLMQTADKGRVTVVELGGKLHGEEYTAWSESLTDLLTQEYIDGLYNRAIKLLPVIAANAKTFARAIEATSTDRRLGDQYGALLAGYLSYSTDKQYTLAEAKEWLANVKVNFNFEKEQSSGRIDQYALFDTIMQQIIKIPYNKTTMEFSIGELCDMVKNSAIGWEDIARILGNYGIKREETGVYIANNNVQLQEMLKNTNWPLNWGQTLKRIENASVTSKNVYFSPACKQKAVFVPIE